MKWTASGRNGKGCGNLAAAHRGLPRASSRDRRAQQLRVRHARRVQHLRRVPLLDDASEVHDGDARGEPPHDAEVVRDQDQCQSTLVAEAIEHGEQGFTRRGVEIGHGLVAHEEIRLRGQRARDGDALAFAAGERSRTACAQDRIEPDFLQQLLGATLCGRARRVAVHLQRLNQERAHRPLRRERGAGVLRHELETTAQRAHHHAVVDVEPTPEHGDGARRRHLEPEHRAGQRALAAATLADEPHTFAAPDGERHAIDGMHRHFGSLEQARRRAIVHGQCVSGDQRYVGRRAVGLGGAYGARARYRRGSAGTRRALRDDSLGRTVVGEAAVLEYQHALATFSDHGEVVRDQQQRGAEATERAIAMLDRVGIRDAARSARRFPHELSGGQRQRMLLALALMLEPDVLIADEPTTALDVTLQVQLLDLLDTLRRDLGTTLLLISHDLAVVGERCERVLVLEDGRLADDGPAERIVAERAARASGAAAVARARAVRPSEPDGTPPDVPLVATDALAVHYRTPPRLFQRPEVPVHAVDGVSLAIGRGECVGLVGESACGKSTLARAMLGLEVPTAGTVTVLGRRLDVHDRVMMRALRRRLQLVPQDAGASLTPQRTVRSLLVEALEVHGHTPGAPAQRRAEQLLTEVGLDPALGARRPTALSSGERQRVAIARALAPQPDLLVCDEPVANLDAAAREPLLAMLDRLRDERGLALLLISHDLGVVRRLASRVAVMYLGRIVEQGGAAHVLDAPRMPYTQLLRAAVPTGRPRRTPVRGGEIPAPLALPSRGCPFHPRCSHPLKDEGCRSERPELRALSAGPDGHAVACLKVSLPPSP